MSMPIQRQSDQFAAFDSGPRWERDRGSHDLPKGLAGLVNSMGPRISAGLLNTRTANSGCEYCGEPGHDWQIHPEAHADVADWEREKHGMEFPFGDHREGEYPSDDDHDGSYWPGKNAARLAVNTEGMDPNEHAYGRQKHDPLFGEFGHDGYDYEGVSRGEYNRRTRDYDADAASQEAREDEDDESGYNWGPVPPEHYGAVSEDYSGGDEDDPDWIRDHSEKQQEHNRKRGGEIAHSKELFGSRLPFDRTAAGFGGMFGLEVDPDGHGIDPDDFWGIKSRNNYCTICGRHRSEPSQPGCAHGDRTSARTADVMPQQPLQGGGYQIGHRIGLPYHGKVHPGTVIGLDGPSVKVRWDNGQYSTEEPHNIQLL